jgi:hypothetical protein
MKRERVAQSKPFVLVKVEPPKARKETPMDAKGKLKTLKRFMILKDHGEIESKSDRYNDDEVPPLKDCSDVKIAYQIEVEVLVIRHGLNVHVKSFKYLKIHLTIS